MRKAPYYQSRYELTNPLLVTPVDCFPTHDSTFFTLQNLLINKVVPV